MARQNEGWVLLAAVLGGVWLFSRTLGKLPAVAEKALASTRNALASGLYRVLGPEEKFGPNLFYNVGFPNGKRHAIGADRVDANFRFIYTEPEIPNVTRWQMLMGPDNRRYAAPL